MMDREELIRGLLLILFGLLLMFLGVSLIIYDFYDIQRLQSLERLSGGIIMVSNWFFAFGVVLLGAGVLTIIFGITIWTDSYYDGMEFMPGVRIK